MSSLNTTKEFEMIRSRKDENGKPRYQAIIKKKGYPIKAKTFRTRKEAGQWEVLLTAVFTSSQRLSDKSYNIPCITYNSSFDKAKNFLDTSLKFLIASIADSILFSLIV